MIFDEYDHDMICYLLDHRWIGLSIFISARGAHAFISIIQMKCYIQLFSLETSFRVSDVIAVSPFSTRLSTATPST